MADESTPELILHDSPDEAVKERVAHLKELKRRGGGVRLDSGHVLNPHDYQLRLYILEDWWFLCRAVLNMHWLDEGLHGRELMRHYHRELPDGSLTDQFDKITLIPRGHVKTLFLGASKQIHRILRLPEIKITYASATMPLAKSVGIFVADTLMYNQVLKRAFPDILPSSKEECSQWGMQGYKLPGILSTDPTFKSASLDTNVTGSHPWILVCDDLTVEQTNHSLGWEKAVNFMKNGLALLPPHGFMEVLATRWHDADPSGQILADEIRGKQGAFQAKVMSCYVDDDPAKGPIWPAKRRWTSKDVSGYTMEQFADMHHTMGSFFNAQYRNDPVVLEDQVINVNDVNIVEVENLPKHGPIRAVGIEVTGGGQLIYNYLIDRMEEFDFTIPFVKIQNMKNARRGLSKHDSIITELEPIVRRGQLFACDWMMEDPDRKTDTLGYEIKRLGAARHDDIVDATHNCIKHLIRGTFPDPREPNHAYISVDLAFTENEKSDFSVCVLMSVDHQGNHYVHDYRRFKIANPTGIADEIIKFYRKHAPEASTRTKRRKRRSFSASYK